MTDHLVTTAMEILSERNRPLKLGDLYLAIVAKGIVVSGKNPRNNLGAKLSADPRLETLPGLGWWFKGEPVPGHPETRPQQQEVLEDDRYEEGPDAYAAEPLQLNGEAGSYPA